MLSLLIYNNRNQISCFFLPHVQILCSSAYVYKHWLGYIYYFSCSLGQYCMSKKSWPISYSKYTILVKILGLTVLFAYFGILAWIYITFPGRYCMSKKSWPFYIVIILYWSKYQDVQFYLHILGRPNITTDTLDVQSI